MKPPIKWITHLPNYLEQGRVLDMGAGSGRNAVYMAE